LLKLILININLNYIGSYVDRFIFDYTDIHLDSILEKLV